MKSYKNRTINDEFLRNIEELISSIDKVRAPSGNLKPISEVLQPHIMEEISSLYYETMNGLIAGVNRIILQQCKYNDGSERIEHKRMQKIMDYLHKNYMNEIREDQIAEHIGMTVPAFCRFFKQHTKFCFKPFLNKFRVSQAIRILEETSDSITTIGYNCGYNDVNYFIKSFKKETGKSPGVYREEFKSKKVI